MKHLKLNLLIAGAALVISSCTKEEMPVSAIEADTVNEVLLRQPSPGTYTIQRFIDTGDDETSQFTGYTFEFQADGDLIATTAAGAVFNGFWDLNSAETVMEISISGTDALEDLDDDDWAVNKISNKAIKISAPGPDNVMFKRVL